MTFSFAYWRFVLHLDGKLATQSRTYSELSWRGEAGSPTWSCWRGWECWRPPWCSLDDHTWEQRTVDLKLLMYLQYVATHLLPEKTWTSESLLDKRPDTHLSGFPGTDRRRRHLLAFWISSSFKRMSLCRARHQSWDTVVFRFWDERRKERWTRQTNNLKPDSCYVTVTFEFKQEHQ